MESRSFRACLRRLGLEGLQGSEFGEGLAVLEKFGCLFEAFREGAREACDDKSGGRIEGDDLRFGAGELAAEDGFQKARVFFSATASEGFNGGRGEAQRGGRDLEGGEGSLFDSDGFRGSCEGEFIGALAVDDPSFAAAESGEHFCVGWEQFTRVHAHELMLGPGGVEERAEEIKDGGDSAIGEAPANGSDDPEGGVIGWGEEKTEAVAFDAFAQFFGTQFDANAEGFEDICAAAFGGDGPVAVFEDDRMACGEDEHGGGGDVEEFELIATRAADIEGGAWEGIGRKLGVYGELEERFSEGGDFAWSFAFFVECFEEGAFEGGLEGWVY